MPQSPRPLKSEQVSICFVLWASLTRQLRRRGYGERESGAFLLGRLGSKRVSKYICYDDLDPSALDTGIIVFRGVGFVRLWDYCRRQKMTVLGDVHTHANQQTTPSATDRTHPMIGLPGHVALIVPHFAKANLFSLKAVGVYQYVDNHQWTSHPKNKFKLTLF